MLYIWKESWRNIYNKTDKIIKIKNLIINESLSQLIPVNAPFLNSWVYLLLIDSVECIKYD